MLNLEFLNLKDAKITLCVSSSISFYKAFEILSLLRRANAKVRVAMSEQTLKFCSPLAFEALSGECVLVGDNKPLAHIEYAKCDLMIIAPATANTINKIALGIADNAMLSCILACRAPKLIAPAANTAMLENPATQNSLKVLKERGFVVVSSCEKTLACGDVGKGALASPKDIVLSAARMLGVNSRIPSENSKIPSENSKIPSENSRIPSEIPSQQKANIAASFERVACLHIIDRLKLAFSSQKWARFGVVGGASANLRLRGMLESLCASYDCELLFAPLEYCSDNAVMIARAAVTKYHNKDFCGSLEMHPRSSLENLKII